MDASDVEQVLVRARISKPTGPTPAQSSNGIDQLTIRRSPPLLRGDSGLTPTTAAITASRVSCRFTAICAGVFG